VARIERYKFTEPPFFRWQFQADVEKLPKNGNLYTQAFADGTLLVDFRSEYPVESAKKHSFFNPKIITRDEETSGYRAHVVDHEIDRDDLLYHLVLPEFCYFIPKNPAAAFEPDMQFQGNRQCITWEAWDEQAEHFSRSVLFYLNKTEFNRRKSQSDVPMLIEVNDPRFTTSISLINKALEDPKGEPIISIYPIT